MNSIVQLCGISRDGHCGYCGGSSGGRKVHLGCHAFELGAETFQQLLEAGWSGMPRYFAGAWAYHLHPRVYLSLLDCGWRRSGCYVYKPIMDETCCPQYTIRLDSTEFFLSRSQKRVLRQMNEFLKNDIRPKSGPVKEEVAMDDPISKPLIKEKSQEHKERKEKHEELPSKKKTKRRERCFEKWRRQGIDIEAKIAERREKEEKRRRTVESFVNEWQPDWKHRLEVKLVSVDGEEIKTRAEESFQLYKKYQTIIHKDEPDDIKPESHKRFLLDSPLTITPAEKAAHTEERPACGSYHQWYLLDDKLIAVGVVDILPRCLSAKYMYYDPDYNFLSLGTYTALREIAFTKFLSNSRPELKYYYMGYYIHSCPKMRYKGKFQPSDLLCDYSLKWAPLSKCAEDLDTVNGGYTRFFPDDEADRQIRQDLTLFCAGRFVSYPLLPRLIPDYQEKETESVRQRLDQFAKLLSKDTTELVVFLTDIHRLANIAADSESDSDDS